MSDAKMDSGKVPKGCSGKHDSFMGENSMCNCFRCGEFRLAFDGNPIDGYLDRIVELKTERDELKETLRMVRESQERQRQLNDALTLERDELKEVLNSTLNYLHWNTDNLSGDDLIGDGKLTARFKRQVGLIEEALKEISCTQNK